MVLASRPWSSSVPCVFPGRPERNRGLSISCLFFKPHDEPNSILSLLIVSMMSRALVFFSDPLSCFTVSPRDIHHDSFVGSLHGFLFRNIPGF